MASKSAEPEETKNGDQTGDQIRMVPLQGYPSGPPGPIIQSQPNSFVSPSVYQGWTTIPLPVRAFNYPTGLDYLTTIDQLLVQQQVLIEGCKDFQSTNRFQIKNTFNQIIFFASEDSTYLSRICCYTTHPFVMKLSDNFGNEILHFHRVCACDCCCFFFCSQKLEVLSPSGTLLAVVQQESTFLYPKFTIKDSSGQIILRVEGPGCRMRCGPVRFKITSHVGLVEVGAITRQWLGFCRECTSDANNFKITFPQNLDVKMKAAVLGACFLIDVLFFEC
ncbi:hypothetical protein Zmor_001188 [Zophobas morio]|uniref:Phospholipid scramblase n=1 Tax=Zophobas morio TaxID=2755281 RepID=A0AA38IY12_9CUCU|nr:hypothetical protein Zmor_001188 [Zophobas morio]